MSLATDLQDDIAELLDDPDVGRNITINRFPPGAYDPATGAVTPGTTQSWSTRGLFLNYSDALVNGSDIQRGDRRCYIKIKNLTYAARIGDKVTAGADIYTVVSFKLIELGGTAVIFILQVRR